MSDLHDARVEASAEAIYFEDCGVTPDESIKATDDYGSAFRELARAALAAADAVVTVEMIAEALHGDECPDDPDEGESCGCDGNHYMRQGEIVLALLRGGEER